MYPQFEGATGATPVKAGVIVNRGTCSERNAASRFPGGDRTRAGGPRFE
jgi:hypothetical protein